MVAAAGRGLSRRGRPRRRGGAERLRGRAHHTDYTKALASGGTAARLAWSGDIVWLQADNPSLDYVLPGKGFLVGTDCLVIPAMAQPKKNPEELINYYYDSEVMAEVVGYINYVGPVLGVKEVLATSGPELAKNELIFPSQETLARGPIVGSLSAAEETSFDQQFQTLVAC